MDIKRIETAGRDRKPGFLVTWDMGALTENGAQFRAVGATAMRFPTTVTDVNVVSVRKRDTMDVEVVVHVPTGGMKSAGIGRPVKWVKEEFPDNIVKIL